MGRHWPTEEMHQHRARGDSSYVQHQLQNAAAIYNTFRLSLLCHLLVVHGAARLRGGRGSGVQRQLNKVSRLYSTGCAFAPSFHNSFIVTCGWAALLWSRTNFILAKHLNVNCRPRPYGSANPFWRLLKKANSIIEAYSKHDGAIADRRSD